MLLVRLVLLVFLTQLIACRPDRDEEEEFELDNDGNHFRKFSTILKKATKNKINFQPSRSRRLQDNLLFY